MNLKLTKIGYGKKLHISEVITQADGSQHTELLCGCYRPFVSVYTTFGVDKYVANNSENEMLMFLHINKTNRNLCKSSKIVINNLPL